MCVVGIGTRGPAGARSEPGGGSLRSDDAPAEGTRRGLCGSAPTPDAVRGVGNARQEGPGCGAAVRPCGTWRGRVYAPADMTTSEHLSSPGKTRAAASHSLGGAPGVL